MTYTSRMMLGMVFMILSILVILTVIFLGLLLKGYSLSRSRMITFQLTLPVIVCHVLMSSELISYMISYTLAHLFQWRIYTLFLVLCTVCVLSYKFAPPLLSRSGSFEYWVETTLHIMPIGAVIFPIVAYFDNFNFTHCSWNWIDDRYCYIPHVLLWDGVWVLYCQCPGMLVHLYIDWAYNTFKFEAALFLIIAMLGVCFGWMTQSWGMEFHRKFLCPYHIYLRMVAVPCVINGIVGLLHILKTHCAKVVNHR